MLSKRNKPRSRLCVPVCNGRSETALQIGTYSLPVLCTRCWAVVFGVVAGGFGSSEAIPTFVSTLLILPCILDGWNSYFGAGTINRLRLLTGFLAGVGMMAIYHSFIKMVF